MKKIIYTLFVLISNCINIVAQENIWTIDYLIKNWKEKGIEEFEGIYEFTPNPDPFIPGKETKGTHPPLRVAALKTNGKYNLYYLEGASKKYAENWKPGDIKATLNDSELYSQFDGKYFNGEKKESEWAQIRLWESTFSLMNTFGYFGGKKIFPTKNDFVKENFSRINEGFGFILNSKGLVSTNSRIVEGAKKISVFVLQNNIEKQYPARIFYKNENQEYSIIEIFGQEFKELPPIPFIFNFIFYLKENEPKKGITYDFDGNKLNLVDTEIKSTKIIGGTNYYMTLDYNVKNIGLPILDSNGLIIGLQNSKNLNMIKGTLFNSFGLDAYRVNNGPIQKVYVPKITYNQIIDNTGKIPDYKNYIVKIRVER